MPDQPSYVSYYGLKNDPFAEVADQPFVPVAGRQKAVDTVLHLLSYSDDVVFVSGSVGSGKSTLLEQIIRQLPENIDLVLVDVAEVSSDKELLWDLATQFNLEPDRSHSTERLQLMLQAHCQALHERGQIPTLAIDDIDELPLDTLGGLTPILQGGVNGEPGLRLVGFASEPNQIRRELSALGFASGQLIELAPFSFDDCVHLVQGYFALGGITSGIPLDPGSLKRLYKLSDGLPGAFLDGVRDFMLVEAQRSRRHRAIPWPHLVAGAAVIAVIALAALYQTGDSGSDGRTEIEISSAGANGLAGDATSAVDEPAAEIDPELAQRSVDDVRARLDQALSERSNNASASAETEVDTDASPIEVEADEVASQPEAPASSPSITDPETPAAENAPEPPRPETTSVNQPLRAPAWLRNADANRYTLQILGARTERNVLEFVDANNLPTAQVGYVRTELDGEPWYVLLYGSFTDRDEARQAITDLPDSVQSLSPWPRTLGSIQALM